MQLGYHPVAPPYLPVIEENKYGQADDINNVVRDVHIGVEDMNAYGTNNFYEQEKTEYNSKFKILTPALPGDCHKPDHANKDDQVLDHDDHGEPKCFANVQSVGWNDYLFLLHILYG
jgi:hypothetical protein